MEDFERMTLENQKRRREQSTAPHNDSAEREEMCRMADSHSGVQMLMASAPVLLLAGGLIVNACWNFWAGCMSAFEGSLSVGILALITAVLMIVDGRKEILR